MEGGGGSFLFQCLFFALIFFGFVFYIEFNLYFLLKNYYEENTVTFH